MLTLRFSFVFFIWLIFLSFFSSNGSHKRGGAQAWSSSSDVFFLLLAVTNPLPYVLTVCQRRPGAGWKRRGGLRLPRVPVHQAPMQEYCHPPETF